MLSEVHLSCIPLLRGPSGGLQSRTGRGADSFRSQSGEASFKEKLRPVSSNPCLQTHVRLSPWLSAGGAACICHEPKALTALGREWMKRIDKVCHASDL